jgi:hypothetical protein
MLSLQANFHKYNDLIETINNGIELTLKEGVFSYLKFEIQ